MKKGGEAGASEYVEASGAGRTPTDYCALLRDRKQIKSINGNNKKREKKKREERVDENSCSSSRSSGSSRKMKR